jgi:hypothetical protein
MKMPTWPTRKALSKLTRAEIEEKLKPYDLEWVTLRDYNDEPDPFLTQPKENEPTRKEQEFQLNLMHLHSAPRQAWIYSLTASQIAKVCKEYKINLSQWTKRSTSLEKLQRQLSYVLPRQE